MDRRLGANRRHQHPVPRAAGADAAPPVAGRSPTSARGRALRPLPRGGRLSPIRDRRPPGAPPSQSLTPSVRFITCCVPGAHCRWRSCSLCLLPPACPGATGAALRDLSHHERCLGPGARLGPPDWRRCLVARHAAAARGVRVDSRRAPAQADGCRFFLSWRPTSTTTLRVRVVAMTHGRVRLKGRSVQLALQPTSQPGASAPVATPSGATPGNGTTPPLAARPQAWQHPTS